MKTQIKVDGRMRVALRGIAAAAALILSTSPASAAPNGKFIQAKPFAYLQEQVDQNATNISELFGITDELRADLTTVETDVSALTERVLANEDSIGTLSAHIDSIYTALDGQNTELDDLYARLDLLKSDVEANAGEILATQVEIDSLTAQVEANQQQVDLALADLEQHLVQQSQALAQLRTQVNNNQAATMAAIHDLVGRINTLNAELDANTAKDQADYLATMQKIMQLNNSVNALNANMADQAYRLNSLEHRFNNHTHNVLSRQLKCDIIGFINPWTPIIKCYHVWATNGEKTTGPL